MHTQIVKEQELIQLNQQMDATDAYSMMAVIIDAQIKFYNSLYLRHWEKDHATSREYYDNKVAELKQEKSRILDFVRYANESDKSIALDCNFRLDAV